LHKKITLSLAQYVYDMYIMPIEGNKSKFIEEMFIKGINSDGSEYKNYKTQNIELNRKLRFLEEKLARATQHIARLKAAIAKETPQSELTHFNSDDYEPCKNCGHSINIKAGILGTTYFGYPIGFICGDCQRNQVREKFKEWNKNG